LEATQSAGDEELVIAHVGIVPGGENTEIAGHTGDNETARAKITQQCSSVVAKKPECFGLARSNRFVLVATA
jgi:hypothetical protein